MGALESLEPLFFCIDRDLPRYDTSIVAFRGISIPGWFFVSAVPSLIVFMLAQRAYVSGVTAGAVKN